MRRHADWIVLAVLFTALTALSWRRWASFEGDLNREWTTPARVAAGERLYRDVAFYYGPLIPHVEGLAMRVFGARVGTAIAFGMVNTAALLALLLVASRGFLPVAARAAVAAAATGVFAFAPENGAFIACYSQSALAAVGLSWLAFVLGAKGRGAAAGIAGALALLAKPEAALALAAVLIVAPRKARLTIFATAGALALAGYAAAFAGIPLDELVRYGPLRHLAMPPEFKELYRRISGLHPALFRRGVTGLAAGAGILLGWWLAVRGLVRRSPQVGLAGGALLVAALLVRSTMPGEPILSTIVRGLPAVLVVAIASALVELRGGRPAPALLAAGAGLLAIAFLWRTFLWNVPLYPYAPLAAVSVLPAVTYLAAVRLSRDVRLEGRHFCTTLLLLPFFLSPLAALPRLITFYRSTRTPVNAPQGLWLPPAAEGDLFASLVAHLQRTGVRDRSLVVLPEASALNFLMGARSPLRMEQLIPGLVDAVADRDAAARLRSSPPERIVWIPRDTPEYGSGRFGHDYASETARVIDELYREEKGVPEPNGRLSRILVRR